MLTSGGRESQAQETAASAQAPWRSIPGEKEQQPGESGWSSRWWGYRRKWVGSSSFRVLSDIVATSGFYCDELGSQSRVSNKEGTASYLTRPLWLLGWEGKGAGVEEQRPVRRPLQSLLEINKKCLIGLHKGKKMCLQNTKEKRKQFFFRCLSCKKKNHFGNNFATASPPQNGLGSPRSSGLFSPEWPMNLAGFGQCV